jgi:hypothetical protein
VIAIVGSTLFNALVNILPLNGITTGEVSNAYPNLFTPANYVFSIWGVIYTLLFVFMFYQLSISLGLVNAMLSIFRILDSYTC